MKRILPILGLALLLAGCGSQEALQEPQGAKAPPKPAMAARAPTTDELLAPTTIAQPDRVDELLTKSQPREDDRFDLPPPGVPAGTVPVPVPAESNGSADNPK